MRVCRTWGGVRALLSSRYPSSPSPAVATAEPAADMLNRNSPLQKRRACPNSAGTASLPARGPAGHGEAAEDGWPSDQYSCKPQIEGAGKVGRPLAKQTFRTIDRAGDTLTL